MSEPANLQQNHKPDLDIDREGNQNRTNNLTRIGKYIFLRSLTILVTIFLGIFILVLVINRSGFIDWVVGREVDEVMESVQRKVSGSAYQIRWQPTEAEIRIMDQARWEIEETAGLHLPYLERQIRWTYNLLTFNWPDLMDRSGFSLIDSTQANSSLRVRVKDSIFKALPNTLLLISIPYFFLFLFGLPFSLFLSRRQGTWLDRIMISLSPISSAPSWVYGIFLVMIFAVGLRLLPVSGMLDTQPPETNWEYIPVVFKHLLLPVGAILLSTFFQCVYTWRTFFLIHAGEDYVELAKAKGLPSRLIERRYILRSTLPYIITNFALMLVTFWQATTALEYFFVWPGIGRLYIISMLQGDFIITLGIVVIFAYLLGGVVFVLDIVYAFVDPRLQMGGSISTSSFNLSKAKRSISSRLLWRRKKSPRLVRVVVKQNLKKEPVRFKEKIIRSRQSFLGNIAWFRSGWHEISRYPSALIGLFIILLLLIGSLYAMTSVPYDKEEWSNWAPEMTGKTAVPKLAKPLWENWFRNDKLPETIVLNSQEATVRKVVEPTSKGMKNIEINFAFDFPAGGSPQELMLYFDATYQEKLPFLTLTWQTPDGREILLDNLAVSATETYDFSENISRRTLARIHPQLSVADLDQGNTSEEILFSDPGLETLTPLPGRYNLRLEVTTFEVGSDLDAKFVLVGQVYGLAGTDYLRRDLKIPLFWGAPVALGFGILGAVITTLLSMVVGATGAWFRGWVDVLIERFTEVNMILPTLAIGVLMHFIFGASLWVILGVIILLNVFSGTTKSYRAAFLQAREAPYVEAARTYGAGNSRIIFRYLIPRILPVLIPQMIALIPGYVFLEATLAIFGVTSTYTPTWGRMIYDALKWGFYGGDYYWILQPISLLLLTGLAFSMLGFALERMLNPGLKNV
jgi:peptide/nickel transport system permease protein